MKRNGQSSCATEMINLLFSLQFCILVVTFKLLLARTFFGYNDSQKSNVCIRIGMVLVRQCLCSLADPFFTVCLPSAAKSPHGGQGTQPFLSGGGGTYPGGGIQSGQFIIHIG